jgi:CBS domain-containing membrane protein
MNDSALQVSELMSSNVITLRENASVGRAHAEMRLGRIRHFPVVNPVGEVVGVVSSGDVAKALAIDGRGRAVAVKDIMTARVETVGEDVPAWQAARILRQKKIGSLPVVNEAGALVGIITDSDFLEVAEKALAGRRLRRIRS